MKTIILASAAAILALQGEAERIINAIEDRAKCLPDPNTMNPEIAEIRELGRRAMLAHNDLTALVNDIPDAPEIAIVIEPEDAITINGVELFVASIDGEHEITVEADEEGKELRLFLADPESEEPEAEKEKETPAADPPKEEKPVEPPKEEKAAKPPKEEKAEGSK
jgi:hypothetical protein